MALFSLLVLSLSSMTVINSQSGYDWCPQYHLIRAAKVYDPSGPIYYNNTWHVFEDSCAWCHYYSSDLIHWKSLSKTGFTGLTGSIGTTITNGNPKFIAFYPAQDQSGIMRATASDDMLSTWNITGMVIKKPSNIINNSGNYRDPLRPITINGETYIGVGSGVAKNGPGMVLWYKSTSPDLDQWQLLGSLFNVSETMGCIDPNTIIYDPNNGISIAAIECPDVFLMEDKYVLITGLFCTNEYWVGNIDTNKNVFNPLTANSNHALLDYGNFYAAKTGTMATGVNGVDRRILFGFTGWQEPTAPSQCGRSHVIPRDITLNNKNMLNFNPVKEIKSLRGDNDRVEKGSELQLILSCNLKNAQVPTTGNLSVNVLVSSDSSQYVQIGYSFQSEMFYVDHTKCCGDKKNIIQTVGFARSQIMDEGGLYLNVLLDRSIIESFLNQQKVITAMVNPSNTTAPQDRGIYFKNELEASFDCYLQSWQLTL